MVLETTLIAFVQVLEKPPKNLYSLHLRKLRVNLGFINGLWNFTNILTRKNVYMFVLVNIRKISGIETILMADKITYQL